MSKPLLKQLTCPRQHVIGAKEAAVLRDLRVLVTPRAVAPLLQVEAAEVVGNIISETRS